MVGADSYFGWGLGKQGATQNQAAWRKTLADKFNDGVPGPDQIGPLGDPYNNGNAPEQPVSAGFVNVPSLPC